MLGRKAGRAWNRKGVPAHIPNRGKKIPTIIQNIFSLQMHLILIQT
jgi:hypothetical protein